MISIPISLEESLMICWFNATLYHLASCTSIKSSL
jgi:hypothetical protein